MEIDLNHAVNGIEAGEQVYSVDSSGNGGDSSLSASSNSSNSSLKSSNPNFESSVYMELWHACAGPLTTLPNKGNVVVYFPQGHLEQIASHSSIQFSPTEVPSFGLQPQIFCKVVDVQLLVSFLISPFLYPIHSILIFDSFPFDVSPNSKNRPTRRMMKSIQNLLSSHFQRYN